MGAFCQKPDRDVPGIKCGYPMPCPWHLDAIIREDGTLRILSPIHGRKRRMLHQVAQVLGGKMKMTRAQQIKGCMNALKNPRTPKQLLPSLRKRLKELRGGR